MKFILAAAVITFSIVSHGGQTANERTLHFNPNDSIGYAGYDPVDRVYSIAQEDKPSIARNSPQHFIRLNTYPGIPVRIAYKNLEDRDKAFALFTRSEKFSITVRNPKGRPSLPGAIEEIWNIADTDVLLDDSTLNSAKGLVVAATAKLAAASTGGGGNNGKSLTRNMSGARLFDDTTAIPIKGDTRTGPKASDSPSQSTR
jgi:hypothetical protein